MQVKLKGEFGQQSINLNSCRLRAEVLDWLVTPALVSSQRMNENTVPVRPILPLTEDKRGHLQLALIALARA